MPIPLFNPSGLLPAFVGSDPVAGADRSPYLTTMSELVVRFGTTTERRVLLRNLIAYRALIAHDGYTDGLQFVDGSFVENVEATRGRPPGDIDVFSFLRAPQKYATGKESWRPNGVDFWMNEIINRAENKRRFLLDTFAILIEEVGPSGVIQQAVYWSSLFSHQRDTFAWKGFVCLPLDPVDDLAASQALQSQP